MDKVQQWVTLAALTAVVLVTGGWFLLISPQRGEAAQLREQATARHATNDQLTAQLAVLRQKAEGLSEQQAQLADAAVKIPSEAALPALLRTLTGSARSAGVELVTVTPGSAVPLSSEAAPAAPADPAAPGDGAAAAQPAAAAAVSAIPLTINVVGDFYEVEQLLVELEDLPRALRVTGLSVTPGASPTEKADASLAESGRSLSTAITAQVYVAAAPTAPAAGASTAAAPAAAGTTSTAPAS